MPRYRRAGIPGGTFFFTVATDRRRKLFADGAGQRLLGSGLIVECHVAPNGVTKRLYVKVTGNDGLTETHNFEVTDDLFRAVEEGAEIDVNYVPDDPRIAQLAEGEVVEEDFTRSPAGSYSLGAAAAVMSLGIFAGAVLAWYGYDIKFDGKGKWLVPIGELGESSESRGSRASFEPVLPPQVAVERQQQNSRVPVPKALRTMNRQPRWQSCGRGERGTPSASSTDGVVAAN